MSPMLRNLLARRGRRGSLIVTSFVIIIAMAAVVGGIHTMLKNQLDQGYELQRISFARLQAGYLAEMGVNHVMYEANKVANVSSANPFTPLGTTTGSAIAIDFKDKVAMTRNVTGATAACIVTRMGASSFRCDATLYVPNVGTYTKRIDFEATYDSTAPAAWELSGYTVY